MSFLECIQFIEFFFILPSIKPIKAACWKARRMVQNSVKFTFITRAMHKYVNQMRQQTIKEEAKIVCVEMRETYQQYRQGTKCDAKLVPCNCQCHKQKTPSNWCAKCRSVHDLKVRFLTNFPELFLVVR